jgi:CO/xanthine dehydrogenase Mo-binding subunit
VSGYARPSSRIHSRHLGAHARLDRLAVTVEVLDRADEPSLGAGEAAQGPTAAAIANAVRDALGVPVRDLPLTLHRIIDALG